MKFVVKGTLAFSVLILGFAGTTARAANLISNGGFETPIVPVGGFTNFLTGSTAITGWTVVGPEASIVNTNFVSLGLSFPAEEGIQWLDLTGDVSNTVEGVEQTVATTPGTTYNLSYFVGNQDDPNVPSYGTTSTVNVLVNGSLLTTSTNSNSTGTVQNWEQFQTSFVASSSSTVIEFLNEDPPTDNTNGLDNVVLTAGSTSSVPEPSTFSLLIFAALACAGSLGLRRAASKIQS